MCRPPSAAWREKRARQLPPRPQAPGSATYSGSRSGLAYKLGPEIGAGGNGVVQAVVRRPELAAKIQKYALSQHDVDKLEVLVRAATPELLAVAAWPTDLLKAANGTVAGFVMPRILDARPLYELYSPRSRLQHFPSADFRFLVHAAANVARLFAAVHKAGFICGDVNHSNILVRQTATVAAVDCDSYEGKISEIPGFGRSLTDKLVIWRDCREKAFVPSAASIIDPHEVQRIDRRLAGRRMKLMKELRKRIAELEGRMRAHVERRNALWARVEAAYQARLTCL